MNKLYLGTSNDLAQIRGYDTNSRFDDTTHTLLLSTMWMNVFRSGQGIPLFDILIALIILKVKKTSDCLQGISKLDHLLKVSVFQIYKDREKRDFFESLLLVGEESDEDSTAAYEELRGESRDLGTMVEQLEKREIWNS